MLLAEVKTIPMPRSPFHLEMPTQRDTAVVFASPHSGRDYPWDFIRDSVLDEVTIRSSEDAFVDQLFQSAPEHGAPLLSATLPRAFVDLNRAADELDPALVTGARQTGHNPRISSGLGVIPRVVANGREIRQGKMTLAEAQIRLSDFYFPYHDCLADLLASAREKFGYSLLIDCHSMPAEALKGTSYAFRKTPDVVLGDRFGASCDPDLMAEIEKLFQNAGLETSRNLPFAGAYVVQRYGKPAVAAHAVQVEIDRSLYMNELTLKPSPDFESFRQMLTGLIADMAALGRREMRLAAE